tara:strand:+ start:45 stop:317 length:273 start_codon:yes stop_codon:yes gene_type:complete
MQYFVYLLISKKKNRSISYVGYTNDLEKRIKLHNSGKGAKFTRGNLWKLIYKKKYSSRSIAMKEEYFLKKNYKLRKLIKTKYTNSINKKS